MTIRESLEQDLKQAMRNRDTDVVASIRSLKARVQEATTARGFSGEADDALYRKTIASYVKSLRKGIEEMAAAGDRGKELQARYEAEIEYLEKFLPKLLGEEETRKLVRNAILDTGVSDPRRAGQVMGALMKAHRNELDAGLAKRIVDEELGSA